jgi:hypothetical protein
MPIDFPPNPSIGATYSYGSILWTYNGTAWDKSTSGSISTYVATLNGLSGGVNVAGGTSISVTPTGNTLTIAYTGTGGGGGISGPYVISFNGLSGAVTGVASIRGLTGAVGLTNGSGVGLSVSGNTLTVSNTGVLNIDGSTGAITNVARTNVDNNFSQSQTMSASNGYFIVNDTDFLYSISLTPKTKKITFNDNDFGTSVQLFFNVVGDQVITFPGDTTVLAGLASTQTFTGTNTFNLLTGFNSGISASGGVTLAGTLKGTTANFTGLVSSTVGFSGSGTNLTNIVKTVNGLSGGVTFAAGTNITLVPSGNTITINSSGGGGSSVYGVTASIDFSENVNGLEIIFYGLGNDYSTSLQNIQNQTISYIYLGTGLGTYYVTIDSITSFYDATNGWSAKLIAKPTFTDSTNPLSTTTAELLYNSSISAVYIGLGSSTLVVEENWPNIASTVLYHQEETYVTKTLTGITWVTNNMFLNCKVLGLTSADHTPEDAILEGVNFEINNILGGTGFDVIGHAPNGTYGKYSIKCQGS